MAEPAARGGDGVLGDGPDDAAEELDNPDPKPSQDGPDSDDAGPSASRHAIDWMAVLIYGLLPAIVLILAMGCGYLKWLDSSVRTAEVAGAESVQAAKDSTVALLSYKPDTVERDLTAARDRMTGAFRDSYTKLTNEVVIPGAKQQQITAAATVPAAASISADEHHAVVLVFVNQTTTIGTDRPTASASSVRVALDKVGDRWLVSAFDPV